MWGSEGALAELLCNEERLPVGVNYFDPLRATRIYSRGIYTKTHFCELVERASAKKNVVKNRARAFHARPPTPNTSKNYTLHFLYSCRDVVTMLLKFSSLQNAPGLSRSRQILRPMSPTQNLSLAQSQILYDTELRSFRTS